MRRNHYADLAADYSRPGLVPDAVRARMIEEAGRFAAMKEPQLPAIDGAYPPERIEAENRDWWPTHCEALRQGRGDLLSAEYRDELVYFCADGPFTGVEQQRERERH